MEVLGAFSIRSPVHVDTMPRQYQVWVFVEEGQSLKRELQS